MEHILITGGAGFLGSHLSDYLLSKGYKVTVADNLITGSLNNISHNINNPRFKFIECDITDGIELDERVDGIYHLASAASPIDYQKYPIETLRCGAEGTYKTLELALHDNAVFLLASTSEVYGDPLVHPQREDYWGNVNPVGPRSVYDEAKRYAEAITMSYHRRYGLKTRIARIFNTYGPRMRTDDGRVVPQFISQALAEQPITVFGDGLQTRSLCYVSDEVEGIYRLFNSDCSDPVNIGNPSEITIIDFAKTIIRLTRSTSAIIHKPLPQDDPIKRRPDISKAKMLLGWEPKVSLEDGIIETMRYYKDIHM